MAVDNNYELKLITKVARLYYFDNLNQQKISEKLNISRSKVSRCLTKAKKKKIVEIKINSPYEKFEELSDKVEKTFNIKECLIVPSSENIEQTYRLLASALAEFFDRVLKENDYIGVGWGTTLKSISRYIEPARKVPIKIIPLVGGLGKFGVEVHTNSVASILAEKYGGISYAMHSPAVLDSSYAKEILENDSNIKEVFNMIDKVSIALLGMSDIGKDSTMIKSGNFNVSDFAYLESLGVIGDVNLIFINKEGQTVNNEIDKRILKAPLEKIKNIKNVVGIAFGKKKVDVIRAALLGKIINIILTDEKTAQNLI